MLRFISVWQRKRRFAKDESKSLVAFYNDIKTIETLPVYQKKNRTLLLIRLDDIGDYLLFRNTLPVYKQSERWHGYKITLLGNAAWKELFNLLDKNTMDDMIWIDKKEYFGNDLYKENLWRQLRKEGFEVVICPSATRPILLDDLCRLAAGSNIAFGFSNITPHQQWKAASDKLYTALYKPQKITHEFFLNQQFGNWCCDTKLQLPRPVISVEQSAKKYMVCFIGASTKSKRWPEKRWIELTNLLIKQYDMPVKIIGIAQHKEEAIRIAGTTGAESVTNTSLYDMISIINGAAAVITNDTMTAHLGVSCNVPVVIVANGNNFIRFTAYEEAGIAGVRAVYPGLMNRKRSRYGDDALHNHIVATSDIATIQATTVLAVVDELFQNQTITNPG